MRLKRRKHALVALVILAGAAAASLALTQAATSSGPPAVVTGSGVRGFPGGTGVTFSFAASSIALPGGVYGTFTWSHAGTVTATMVVTCLQVSGKTATIGGVVTSGYGLDGDGATESNEDLTGDWVITTVQDNGRPVNGVSPDKMGYIDWSDRTGWQESGFPTFQSVCNDPADAIGDTTMFSLTSGDITIR